MQASLKLNTKNIDYVLVQISNKEDKERKYQPKINNNVNYLHDSNITHSRMTQTPFEKDYIDCIVEEQNKNSQNKLVSRDQCPFCSSWKQWALQQQASMLTLEKQILERENMMQLAVQKLKANLKVKTDKLQQYRQLLDNSNAYIAELSEQIKQKQLKIIILQRQNKSHLQEATMLYTTPLKIDANSQRYEYEGKNLSTKLSQIMTDDKKGRTCTTMTKHKLDWSVFQTNQLQFTKQNNKATSDNNLSKYIFENTMLKEYNAVLLQRIKQSKYRKHF